MKVITEKGGIKARSVNDRAIEHSVSQKTELSKKNERELTGKAERAVHQADRNVQKAEIKNGAVPNRPIPAQQKKNGVAFEKPQYGETTSTAQSKSPLPKSPSVGVDKKTQRSLQEGIKTAPQAEEKTAPTPFRPPKQFHFAQNQPKNKRYKVLKNGTVDNGGLTKKRERVIYSQQQKEQLKNAKPKKIDKPISSPAERLPISVPKPKADRKSHIISRIKLKKFRLKKVKRQRIRLSRKQTATLRNMFSAKKTLGGAIKAAEFVKKPIDKVKGTVLSQPPKTDKTEDTGTEALKLGEQGADYLKRGLKTAKNVGTKTAEKSTKLAKRVYRKYHKITRVELKRNLRKQVDRQFSGQLRYLTKRAVNKGARAAAKTTVQAAKTAARTAKQAAQVAQKAAQAASKAVASAISKVVSFISSTMPYSLIIIGAILLILILCLCMTEVIGSVGGSVAGGGAWLVDDNSSQTPEEIYEGYKDFVEEAKEVVQTQAKNALKNSVSAFCASDTEEPRKIIQYIDKDNNRLFYPAAGADSTINPLIEEFGTEDYADYMSLLFVLMTREKQQADGVSDGEIYDFDFKKEDFEEFIKSVNENSCRWGDTFVIKTTLVTSPVACTGQNCKTKTKPDCECAYYIDNEGHKHYFCAGHPYCPVDHTMLTVQLYTVKDYYDKEYPEIYNFTDNEKARYQASKAIIQSMIDYWEGGND